jgi:hypothetical protein
MNLAEFKLAAEAAPRKGKRKTQAHTVLVDACLTVCKIHVAVEWAWKMNVGKGYLCRDLKRTPEEQKAQWVSYGFPGLSDIIGMLEDGKLLACEVKVWPDELSGDQEIFLQIVNASGGLGIVVYDHRELVDALDRWRSRHKP